MKTYFHMLVSSANPRDGGMEESALRIAGHFRNMGRTRVAIYTRARNATTRPPELPEDVEHVSLASRIHRIAAPLTAEPVDQRAELYRVTQMLFFQEVRARMRAHSEFRHVIVSLYVSSTGFIAQHVASELDIPHIASVRGTDFHKDFFNPYRFSGVELVAKNATYIVTTNEQQGRVLRKFVPDCTRVRTIYNSISVPLPAQTWSRSERDALELICDSGFAYKKSTHLLLDAFSAISFAYPYVNLTIAGSVDGDEKAFWDEAVNQTRRLVGDRLRIIGHLPKPELIERLLCADIFVSASLAEGCSNSHMLALALGIPIVATRTGALAELADGASHINLCEPGSAESFARSLSATVESFRSKALVIDQTRVQQWRELAAPERERFQWEQVVANTLPKRDTVVKTRQGRVLFFVHDGTGLGHLRRVARLAEVVQGPCASLVVSGHRQAADIVSHHCEFVHLPSLDSMLPNKARYWGRKPFLDVSMKDVMTMRKEMLQAVFNAFTPDAIVVDYLPLGKHNELSEIIARTNARLYFILRGVLDHPDNVRIDLLGGAGEVALEQRYHRLLVASDRRICDVVAEYALSPKLAEKVEYIGYISEPISPHLLRQVRAERGVPVNGRWVVCSAGGGALGEQLIEECTQLPGHFPDVFFDIITGPRTAKQWTFLSADMHVEGKVRLHRETSMLAKLHASADVVICAGGYNSLVEAMEGQSRIVTCPVQLRTNDEQFIHGKRLSEHYPMAMITNLHDLEGAVRAALNAVDNEPVPPAPRSILAFDGARRFRQMLLNDLGLVQTEVDVPHVRR